MKPEIDSQVCEESDWDYDVSEVRCLTLYCHSRRWSGVRVLFSVGVVDMCKSCGIPCIATVDVSARAEG